jgi:putative nucleotidyltransferase with HDIG domain
MASHHLSHIASLEELLQSILEDAVKSLDAQRGAIVLWDEVTQQLILKKVSTGERDIGGRTSFSRSLAQRCFSRHESLLCRDVNDTPELLMQNSIADGTMSSIICALLRSPRKALGVLHLDRGPFQEPFTKEDLSLADALAASVSAGIESAQLMEKQRNLFLQTVTALAQAVELRDSMTGDHTQRVTDYALLLAKSLKVTPREMELIQQGAPLHDIGKIGIKDEILLAPRRLTAEEFEIMKSHTVKGAEILKSIPELRDCIPIVRNHHERWDGGGYPDHLKGDRIPLLARIVAVADAFDAMTTQRPYAEPMPLDKAFAEIRDKAGLQFDPDCSRAFLKVRADIETSFQIRHPTSDAETMLPQVLDIIKTPVEGLRPAAG